MDDKAKLYCYVDETGLDTKGEIFIVVVIIIEEEREQLEKDLEKLEISSGKGKRKWINTREKEKCAYLKLLQEKKQLQRRIFYSEYINTIEYEKLTALTIKNAIEEYIFQNNIYEYKTTVIIDGLNQKVGERIAVALRNEGIKTRKVKGEKDENSALLRLTDALAGSIREAKEPRSIKTKNCISPLFKENILIEIKPQETT